MRERFIKFIEQPSLESFMDVRRALLATEAFDPYSPELDDIQALMAEGKWEEIVATVSRNLIPNHLLSPGAHMMLSFAHDKLGREQEAAMEHMISTALIDGIKSTGDGTPEKPYIVTRTSDEYDILMVEGLAATGQALMSRDGREFDVMSVDGGTELWFDITEIKAILSRRLGFPPR